MGNNIKLLITENDLEFLIPAVMALREVGHEALEASTGEEGLEKTRAHRPDMILSGGVLPDISGIETCRQIKEEQDLKDIFVILTSGVQTSYELCRYTPRTL